MELYQERLLKVLLIVIWTLALLHMTAESYHLYWTFKWLDTVTHFIGGVWVGLAGIWLWYFSGYFKEMRMPDKKLLSVVLFSGILIGVFWEFFEYIVRYFAGNGLPDNYIFDTSVDLFMDIAGSLAGFFVAKYFIFKVDLKSNIL